MDLPKVVGTIKIKKIPPAGHGQGQNVGAKPWRKLFDQVVALPRDTALTVDVSNKNKAWVSGRMFTHAQRRGYKIRTAIRGDVIHIWIVDEASPEEKANLASRFRRKAA